MNAVVELWRRIRNGSRLQQVAVLALLAVSVLLVAGFIAAVLVGLQLREETVRAQLARDFLLGMFHPAENSTEDVSIKQMLLQGRSRLQSDWSDQPLLQAELLSGIGDAFNSMDEFAAAEESYAQAARSYALAGNRSAAAHAILDQTQIVADALEDTTRASGMLEQVTQLYPGHADDGYFMARYGIEQMLVAQLRGDVSAKKQWYERTHSIADASLNDLSARTVFAIRAMADAEAEMGAYQAAIDRLSSLLARLEKLGSARASDVLGLSDDRANVEMLAGRYRSALEHFETATKLCEQGINPTGVQCKYLQYHRAQALLALGFDERAMDTLPALLPERDSRTLDGFWAASYAAQAYTILVTNRKSERYPVLSAMIDLMGVSEGEGKQANNLRLQALLGQAKRQLLSVQPAQAQQILANADAMLEGSPSVDWRHVGRWKLYCALAAQAMGDRGQALDLFKQTHTLHAQALGADHPLTLLVTLHQARALWADRRPQESRELMDHAIPLLEKAMGGDAPTLLHAKALRAELTGKSPQNVMDSRKMDIFL
jgi:tetratricopeptide (TPR) repeat protein